MSASTPEWASGLLSTKPGPDDPEGFLYPIEGIQSLLRDLEGYLPPTKIKPKRPVTMATIARQVPIPGFNACDVVEAIRAGHLGPFAVAAKARGLHRFLFRQSDVNQLSSVCVDGKPRTHIVGARGGCGTRGQTGSRLSLSANWAASDRNRELARPTGRRITEGAMAAFRRITSPRLNLPGTTLSRGRHLRQRATSGLWRRDGQPRKSGGRGIPHVLLVEKIHPREIYRPGQGGTWAYGGPQP